MRVGKGRGDAHTKAPLLLLTYRLARHAANFSASGSMTCSETPGETMETPWWAADARITPPRVELPVLGLLTYQKEAGKTDGVRS